MRISDWSSDVCSSDLEGTNFKHVVAPHHRRSDRVAGGRSVRLAVDRKSVVSGKSVAVRVDLGGRRIIKKKRRTSFSHAYVRYERSSRRKNSLCEHINGQYTANLQGSRDTKLTA